MLYDKYDEMRYSDAKQGRSTSKENGQRKQEQGT